MSSLFVVLAAFSAAAADPRCAGVTCPSSVFVQAGAVSPLACAVLWAADFVPRPKPLWKGCCFDAKVDCAKASMRALARSTKIVPAYGDTWLAGFAGSKQVGSRSACVHACDTTPGCAGGTFLGRDGSCWLVPSVGKVRDPCAPEDGCAAFVKSAGEEAEVARRAALAQTAHTTAAPRIPAAPRVLARSTPAVTTTTHAPVAAAAAAAASSVQELRVLIGLPGVSAAAFGAGGTGAARLAASVAMLCGAPRKSVEVQGAPTVGAKGIGVSVAIASTSSGTAFLNRALSAVTDPDFAATLSRRLARGMDLSISSAARPANPFGSGSGFSRAVIKDTQIASAKPRPCTLSQWSAWSACTATCGGGGAQHRTRSVLRAGSLGAAPCALLEGRRLCRAGTAAQAKQLAVPCPMPCQLGAPTRCTPCSKRCGGGEQECLVSVLARPKHGGAPCPEPRLNDYFILMGEKSRGKVNVQQRCNTRGCPVDCAVSYSAWSSCSATCGRGTQKRRRTVVRAMAFGGKPCVAEATSSVCNAKPCPGPCVLASWGLWGPCSKTCGNDGARSRSRRVLARAAGGGMPCAATTQSKLCASNPDCHVDCKLSAPVCTSACSKSCGKGGVHRSCVRKILQKPWGGKPCGALVLNNVVPCTLKPCPVDCAVSAWSLWLPCSQSCASVGGARAGTRTRIRRILGWGASFGGAACPPLVQRQACGVSRCPVDCVASDWKCRTCSKTCGSGIAQCKRRVVSQGKFGGRICARAQPRPCQVRPCRRDCTVSAWSAWSACSKTCGLGGVQKRSRSVTQQPRAGGKACPPATGSRYCAWQGQCPVDCATSAWSTWTACSRTCGGGTRMRHRWVRSQTAFGGRLCPALDQHSACATAPCAVDCKVGPWTACAVAQCSAKCGGGTMQCHRVITAPAAAGGRVCPATTNTVACNLKTCAVDCTVSEWGSWSVCSKSCGSGSQMRSRKVRAVFPCCHRILPPAVAARTRPASHAATYGALLTPPMPPSVVSPCATDRHAGQVRGQTVSLARRNQEVWHTPVPRRLCHVGLARVVLLLAQLRAGAAHPLAPRRA